MGALCVFAFFLKRRAKGLTKITDSLAKFLSNLRQPPGPKSEFSLDSLRHLLNDLKSTSPVYTEAIRKVQFAGNKPHPATGIIVEMLYDDPVPP